MRDRSQPQYHEKDSNKKEMKDKKYESEYFSSTIPVSKNLNDGSLLIKFVKPVAL